MPELNERSLEKLAECHNDLQVLCNTVIKFSDFIVAVGHRDEKTQNGMVARGFSKLKWPLSKHNKKPSLAVDIYPVVNGSVCTANPARPDPKKDKLAFCRLAGHMLATACDLQEYGLMSHNIRWGGDWNRNNNIHDDWNDMPHFECDGKVIGKYNDNTRKAPYFFSESSQLLVDRIKDIFISAEMLLHYALRVIDFSVISISSCGPRKAVVELFNFYCTKKHTPNKSQRSEEDQHYLLGVLQGFGEQLLLDVKLVGLGEYEITPQKV